MVRSTAGDTGEGRGLINVGEGGLFDWGQVPLQVVLATTAFLLCAVIGMERQFQHKAAGIRTHALVGLGSCVFTLISVEGFVYLAEYQVTRDPSRIAAQIVSGIGFLGAGVIFVNRDVVRGLTTAATVWLSAAIGMACGSGLIPLAVLATGLHFVAAVAFPPLARRLPQKGDRSTLVVSYLDGKGVLRTILEAATDLGCKTTLLNTRQRREDDRTLIRAEMRFQGGPSVRDVMTQLAELPGVVGVEQAARADPDEL